MSKKGGVIALATVIGFVGNLEARTEDYTIVHCEIQKWLRDTHKTHIEIFCNHSGWGWIITKLNGTVLMDIENDVFSETYEGALESGIQVALLNLKQK